MLSKDNTPSAKVFAEQRCRKADSRTECWQSDKAHRTGQRRILASGRKNGLIFLEGAQFAVCLFLGVSKNISPMEYQNSIQTGSILLSVCCFSFGCFYIDFSVSRLFPLPSASIVQTWKGKGFRAEYPLPAKEDSARNGMAVRPFRFQ